MSTQTVSNQQAPTVHNTVEHTEDEFSKAMGLIGSEPEAEEAPADLDPVEEAEDSEAKKLPTAPKEVDPAQPKLDPEEYDKVLMKRKQLWQQQKAMRQERQELDKLKAEIAAAKTPAKPKSTDPVDEMLESEEEWLPPSKLKEKLRQEIMDDLKKERSTEMQQAEQEAQIDIFKSSVVDCVMGNEDKFPTVSMFLDPEEIEDRSLKIIESDYQMKAEKYGHDYAAEKILTAEQVAGILEKNVAEKYGPRLKSERSKKYLRQFLGDQKDSKQPGIQTLNSDLRNATVTDDGPSDWEDRIKWVANKFVKEE